MRHVNIPIFVAHMGCPFDCIFCNQKSITHTMGNVTTAVAQQRMEEGVSTLREECEAEIAFFGGSFSGIEKTEQEALLRLADRYVKEGKVQGIRLSTRPDLIDEEVLQRFLNYGVTAIELGVQSLDDGVLLASKRGYTKEAVFESVQRIRQYPFELGLQMMVGLPTDTLQKTIMTAQTIVKLGADTTRVYPTIVLKNTAMETLYLEGGYEPLDLETATQWCSEIVPIFEKGGVKILRLGLMAEENLDPEKDLVAGPFHPSFGELVQSRQMRNQVEGLYKDGINQKKLALRVHPKDVSKLIGNCKCNLAWLKNRFQLESLLVVQDETQPRGIVTIV